MDISNDYDTRVYVDPYAIEIQDDLWADKASENISSFFEEVLKTLKSGDIERAEQLMSHFHEPKETFIGDSKGKPRGRGLGQHQAKQLIDAIIKSKAYQTGLLSDLSEMALYIEGVNKDKISDLTTNIIRNLLVQYTVEQCALYNIPLERYPESPAFWDCEKKNWVSKHVKLPRIEKEPILLIPKYIVRRKLSLDSQEFYNKNITDFLIAENLKANSSLVQTLKNKKKRVYKEDVRRKNPYSQEYIVQTVQDHPELLELYKKIAKNSGSMITFNNEDKSIPTVCAELAKLFPTIKKGKKTAHAYHNLVLGALTVLFYPNLIQPSKEWDINDGRKRIDIVFTNSADTGFFSQRRNEAQVNANMVIVECKNYSKDIVNPEIDQLLGRFDNNRGKFGIMTCRKVDKPKKLLARCQDLAKSGTGYILCLTDDDFIEMLEAKSKLKDSVIEELLFQKYRELIS